MRRGTSIALPSSTHPLTDTHAHTHTRTHTTQRHIHLPLPPSFPCVPCEPARVQVLDLGNEIHNLNILDRALLIGGESWLDGGVVVENIGACARACACGGFCVQFATAAVSSAALLMPTLRRVVVQCTATSGTLRRPRQI